MDVVWMVVITVVVFLIVFFVAWGVGVKPLTAVALACVWTLLIQAIMTPTSIANISSFQWNGWATFYSIMAAAFFIYLIVYVTMMATRASEHDARVKVKVLEVEISGSDDMY